MNIKNYNNLKPVTSYQSIKIGNKDPETTVFNDLRIAEHFGTEAIQETYNRLSQMFLNGKLYWYCTELMYILNSLCWMHYEWDNIDYSKLYADLFYEFKHKCLDLNEPELNRLYFDYVD